MAKDNTWLIVRKAYLKLFPVQVLGIIVAALNGFIDSLVTSRFLGTNALAAIGFFGPVATVIGITWVLTTGIQMLCSQAIGSGDKDRVISLYSTGILILSIFSLAVTAICLLFHNELAVFLGARESVKDLLSGYIVGYAPGIIGQVLSGVLMVFLPFNNDTRRSYLGIGTMVISNIILDLLCALVLKWGCFGMGFATSVSYLLSSIVMLTGFIGKSKTIHLNFSGLMFGILPKAAYLGLPSLMFTLGCTAKSYIINISLMKNVGGAAVAVMNVQNSIIAILGAIPMGCTGAFLTLASLYYGDEDRKSLVVVTKLAMRIGLVLSSILTVTLMLDSSIIPGMFFSRGEEAWELARRMLILFPNWLVLNLLFNLLMKIYQCQEKMLLVNVLSFAENVVIAIIAATLTVYFGADGVWVSFTICEIIFLIIIMISVFMNSHKITFALEDWMKLADDFGASENECMEFSLCSMDEVVNISENVVEFCKQKGIDKKKSMMAGLAIEEMAGNVVEHGFKDGKKHSIDVRIVTGDDLTIRIRDDCREFDPQKYLDQFSQEDPAKNIGLKIITRMAKEVSYQNNAGINTLLIKV